MKRVYQYLERKQAEFARHPFFKKLAQANSLDEFVPVAQRLTFWVMSFQDLLKLNTAHITHPKLSKIAQCHQQEDSGHEEWFLSDLISMNSEEPNLRSLYSREYASTREASYVILSQVFQAQNDYERIALLLTIESAAQVFFEAIADFSERKSYSSGLLYFSNHHLNAEESHESFAEEGEAYLNEIRLTQDEEKGIFAVIDRVYAAFMKMFDYFQTKLKSPVAVSV